MTASGASQEPVPFRTGVTLTRLDVAIKTAPRRPLTVHDFDVLEDGVHQRLEFLLSGTAPIALWLVVDGSQSISAEGARFYRTACQAIVSNLSPVDALGILVVTNSIRITRALQPATPDACLWTADGTRLGTNLRDGIFAALVLEPAGEFRPILVSLSDGSDNSSVVSFAMLRAAVDRTLATFFPAMATGPGVAAKDPWARTSRAVLQQFDELATLTGGHTIRVDSNNVSARFRELIADLRSRSVIGYYPRPAGGPPRDRAIIVRVNGHRAIARRSYWR